MVFRKKADIILTHKPDILIIPECEHPDKLKFRSNSEIPDDLLWFGTNFNKGLGIFSYGNFKFKTYTNYNSKLQIIVPILVTNLNFNFTLFAIWANNVNDSKYRYIGQIWKAIRHYKDIITRQNTILVGDFNSNTIWDKPKRIWNHSKVVHLLEQKGIHSTYHKYFKQIQGKEQHPTLYMYRHKDKPYHIDYCFVSEDLIKKLTSVEIGDYNFWIKYSDHMPIITTFDFNFVSLKTERTDE